MSEQQETYKIDYIKGLSDKDYVSLNAVLAILSPEQLAMIAQKVGGVINTGSIGRVIIVIEKHHLAKVGVEVFEKFIPRPVASK